MTSGNHEKDQKLRKVQGLYRKEKNIKRTEEEDPKGWMLFMNICFWMVFFLLIMGGLFDQGVQVPSIFGE